jgi:hypothetical protein
VNPRTIRWQASVMAPLLLLVILAVAPGAGVWIIAPALVLALALNAGYACSLGARGRPEGRVLGDRWVARFVAAGLIAPALVAIVLVAAGYNPRVHVWDFTVNETATLAISAAILFTLILLSSLVDWYYIRPRIDGVVCAPPCRSSGSDTWKRPTRWWLLHRGLATLAYMAFALVVALVLMLMLVRDHPAAAGVIGGVGGIAGLLLIFAGNYRSQLPIVAQWTLSPAFCLGDDLTYEGRRGPERGFVLHVAVPVTKLVPLDRDGTRSGGDFVERKNTALAEADLTAQHTVACKQGCAKLNPRCVFQDERRDAKPRLLVV